MANVINARRSFLNRRSPGRVITPDRAAAARLRDAYASLLLAAAMASLSCFFFCDEEKVLTLSPHRGGWIRRWGSRLLPISVMLLPLLAIYLVQICWAFCAFNADCHADDDVFPVDLIYCQRKRRFRRLLSSTRIIWTSCGKSRISPFQRRLCSISPSLMSGQELSLLTCDGSACRSTLLRTSLGVQVRLSDHLPRVIAHHPPQRRRALTCVICQQTRLPTTPSSPTSLFY